MMAELRDRARAVIEANHTGRWTKPSAAQYPHQWNWDSAFISLGWAEFDWDRATGEIESMLAAQWRDGMVPHVHYDRAHLEDYFPGPDRWPGAQARVRRLGELTSGISNPPVLAIAAARIGAGQPDLELRHAFWRRVLGPLVGYLGYLLGSRQVAGSPLVCVIHPWETGWDNSPRWDHLKAAGLKPARPYERLDTKSVAAGQRPSGRDYDSYIALAEIIDGGGYRLSKYLAKTPFVVNDVVFDALTLRAANDVNLIAQALDEEAPFPEAALATFRAAFEEFHWSARLGTYVDFDVVAGRPIETPSAAGLAALAGGFVPAARSRAMLQAYLSRGASECPLATVPPDSPDFDPVLYWRGPTWINVNWLVHDGLVAAGLTAEATALRRATLRLVERGGFAEYFNPLDGSACGIQGFSWSAALTLDLLRQPSR